MQRTLNPVKALQGYGQSIWLDYISRSLITSGQLRRLVDEGLRGVTSNPSIFQGAITEGTDYDEAIQTLLEADPYADVNTLYESLVAEDIQMAADILRPVYDSTEGTDGFVSLEVSPHLAHDSNATIAEAHRLWQAVDRPNLMIKVPATAAGIPVIETLIAEGLNVNATLMFSLGHYGAVAHAFIRGLERNPDPSQVASVASFFVSRVDTTVDRALEAIGSREALALRGKISIANTKMVYQTFLKIFCGEAFSTQRQRGARVQRPLWGSTSTKNPAYSVMYVDELIGPAVVNTVPLATLEAFLDHGRPAGFLAEVSMTCENDSG